MSSRANAERLYRLRCIEKAGVEFAGTERLLDAGCGNGGVSRLLGTLVAHVIAIDVAADPAWQQVDDGVEFMVASAEQMPFDDASFDALHSKDSLHHMDDPQAALREYRRVVRPGGSVLIIEGNRYNPLFYVHMTKMLGHEHFSRRRFRALVRTSFPEARFGSFEAHFIPQLAGRIRAQQRAEDVLARIPGADRFLSYNFAVSQVPSRT